MGLESSEAGRSSMQVFHGKAQGENVGYRTVTHFKGPLVGPISCSSLL